QRLAGGRGRTASGIVARVGAEELAGLAFGRTLLFLHFLAAGGQGQECGRSLHSKLCCVFNGGPESSQITYRSEIGRGVTSQRVEPQDVEDNVIALSGGKSVFLRKLSQVLPGVEVVFIELHSAAEVWQRVLAALLLVAQVAEQIVDLRFVRIL